MARQVLSTPDAISETIRAKIPGATSIGMESGTLPVWLWNALREMGLPVVCLHAKHVARFLELRLDKTDKNDARAASPSTSRRATVLLVNVKTMEGYRLSVQS